MRLVEQRAVLGEAIDVKADTLLLLLAERSIPIGDLGLEFDLALEYSTHAIPCLDGSRTGGDGASSEATALARARSVSVTRPL